MINEIKHLVAGIRANFPSEPVDAVVNVTLMLDDGTQYKVTLDGMPPNDRTTVIRGEQTILDVQNWGASYLDEVTRIPTAAFIDSPETIATRRENLKNFDNKRESGRWNKNS